MPLSPYEIVLILLLIIQFYIMLKFYSKSYKKFSKFIFGFSSGILTLYPTVFALSYFGQHIQINIFTLSIASILGIPGTALIAIANCLTA